jgi:CubicO group peptidase (beta-lactamase class C family)
MAKTLTAVIAGMLARRDFLATDEVALFKPWEDDERIHISLDQLLRMTSGINILENKTGADANSHMLFKTGDSTAYAIGRGLRDTPGENFAYTSGSTMLVARIISERLGGRPETLGFIRRELFEPLEMDRTLLEPDETGQFIGSSFVMASAHDWGRFGLMLLNGGEIDGNRIIDRSWIDYMTTPTPQAEKRPYGAGVWLIDPASAAQPWMQELPADAWYASGLQTNQLWIIPSRELVVVRLGATGDFSRSGVIELLTAVLAAQLDPATQSST